MRTRSFALLILTGLLSVGFVVAAPPATAASEAQMRSVVLTQLNYHRRLNHLPALIVSSRLAYAARRHNLAMAQANTMSHQLPGEYSLGTRIQRCYYNNGSWASAGENIGWNTDITMRGAIALENMMYAERAPNDGHRRNILSSAFRHVGVDVYVDRIHHKFWLTQDFGQPR